MSWPNECAKKAGVPAKGKRRKSFKAKGLRRFGGREYNSQLVKRMSGGDRIRTCDLEVMSLAKKRRNAFCVQDLRKRDLSRSPPRSHFLAHGMDVERHAVELMQVLWWQGFEAISMRRQSRRGNGSRRRILPRNREPPNRQWPIPGRKYVWEPNRNASSRS